MKPIQTLLCAAAAGTIAFTAVRAPAFPLTLNSLSGTLTTTADFGTNADTTTDDYTVKRFSLKDVLSLLTNTVKSVAPEVVLPKKVVLAVDFFNTNPITYTLVGSNYLDTNFLGTFTNYYTLNIRNIYLTNDLGFYFGLIDSNRNLASFSISAIATKFKYDPNGRGWEKDVILANLNLHNLKDQNGNFHQITITGAGRLKTSLHADGTAVIDLAAKGAGIGGPQDVNQGLFQNYYGAHGICAGSFSFKGSGIPPDNGLPFSVYWWNNLRQLPQMMVASTNHLHIEPPTPPTASGLYELP